MRKIGIILSFLLLVGIIAACSDNEEGNLEEELPDLDVDFDVPETANPGEEVHLEVYVTYSDQPVEEADEVLIEIWESGQEDDSEKIDAENKGDGIYTLDYTFDEDGVYEMFAHTTAEGLHTMPKKQIIVGDAEPVEDDKEMGDDTAFHTDGFNMHFMEPENVKLEEETPLITHITLNEEELTDLDVRYEIVEKADDENIKWVDAPEDPAGEYSANHTFPKEGAYNVTIHVQDDDDLHEHVDYDIIVKK